MGLLFTGMWSLMSVEMSERTSEYKTEFALKMLFMLVAVLAGVAHSFANVIAGDNAALRRTLLAVGGAVGLVAAIGALYFGVALRS